MSKYANETFPNLDNDLVANAAAVLEQYRQSVVGRQPLSLEWLFDSLRDGEVKDLYDYSAVVRENADEHAAAIERAGGPFDASYNPPPVIIGEEGAPAPEPPPPPAPLVADERSEEEKPDDEQRAANEDDGIENASPEVTEAAAKLAEELGVDLAEVKGTGAGDKIVVGDVKAAAETA